LLLVAVAFVLVEKRLENLVGGKIPPQGVEGVGQRQAGENVDGDGLGRLRTGSHNH
jgi:hypothetical protein